MNDYKMTPGERRATWGLGTVFSLRMLGMFMVLPVLTTYGMALQGASEALIGIAIGIYGLTQAVFQIPFGLLSDRIGRKPLIVGGLAVFAAGSVIAALSDSIWGIILGRALQGSGAIAAAVMALLSDLTREQNRTKAMAFIGVSFGITFAIAMVLGPIITHKLGLHALFWMIAILATTGIALTIWVVPNSSTHVLNREYGIPNAWQGETNFWGSTAVSIDRLAAYKDVDVLCFDHDNSKDMDALMATPLWQAMPFVRTGRFQRVPAVWFYGATLSAMHFVRVLDNAIGGKA